MREERANLAMGGDPSIGIEAFSSWRDTTDESVLHALRFYGTFLQGQVAGFSDALSLPAVETAMNLAGIERDQREELTRRLIIVHASVMECQRLESRNAPTD